METKIDVELHFAELAITADELALIETVMPELLINILQSSEIAQD